MREIDAALERVNRERYSGTPYCPDTITHLPDAQSDSWSNRLLQLRLDSVVRLATAHAAVLDLCCGNGAHLAYVANHIGRGVGLDYSLPFVKLAQSRRREMPGGAKLGFVCGNARSLPFSAASFDIVYSLSALYYVPRIDEVIAEVARVLRPGGFFVADFGNRRSLNSFVGDAYPDLARLCHNGVSSLRRSLETHGLKIRAHRSFQLLPMWGDRPRWLKPLLHPAIPRMLGSRLGGRMLDEIVSSLPILREFAFRHFFVCEKPA